MPQKDSCLGQYVRQLRDGRCDQTRSVCNVAGLVMEPFESCTYPTMSVKSSALKSIQ
jgi:hypothetical protein